MPVRLLFILFVCSLLFGFGYCQSQATFLYGNSAACKDALNLVGWGGQCGVNQTMSPCSSNSITFDLFPGGTCVWTGLQMPVASTFQSVLSISAFYQSPLNCTNSLATVNQIAMPLTNSCTTLNWKALAPGTFPCPSTGALTILSTVGLESISTIVCS